jgi:hypothetical protein
VRAIYRSLGAAAGIAILAACSSGQSAIQPPSTSVNVQQQSTLQFSVGTANFHGSTYLNTVVTFRQPNGLSATLYNTPTITGPAGFVVAGCPAASNGAVPATTVPCADNGTNHISGTPPTQPGTAAVVTTFNQTGGAFAYGFAPANSSTGGTAYYPGNPSGRAFGWYGSANFGLGGLLDIYGQPLLAATGSKLPFVLAPPATPDFHNPNAGYPAGFAGYDSGFVMFAVTPVVGAYNLNIAVPSSTAGVNSAVFNATSTLASATPLPNEAAPVLGEPGGAGTGSAVTFTVAPAPAGTTSQVLYIVDINGASGALTFYSVNAGTAGGTFTLPGADFHPANADGTNNDAILTYSVAANWDIVGDAPPGNTSAAPPLPANTNITVSAPVFVSYQ